MGGIVSIPKDRMDTPSSGSEDEAGIGAVDLSDLAHELDQDEFDGPILINGMLLMDVVPAPQKSSFVLEMKLNLPYLSFTENRRRSSSNHRTTRDRMVSRSFRSLQL